MVLKDFGSQTQKAIIGVAMPAEATTHLGTDIGAVEQYITPILSIDRMAQDGTLVKQASMTFQISTGSVQVTRWDWAKLQGKGMAGGGGLRSAIYCNFTAIFQ